jgi:uncharacterized membrane-anchored protein YitT (DUF2179 family)
MSQLISALGFWNTTATRHTPVEDVQGVFSGSLVSALGLYVLASAGLLTGSTAGIAFLLHYAFGVNFGLAFFLLNLPFFYLSWKRLGMAFTIKTFIAIGLTSALTSLQPKVMEIATIHPAWAALLGGLLLGFGLLALYRHRASLGGVGILGIYMQERFGIRAGLVQLASICACWPPPSSSPRRRSSSIPCSAPSSSTCSWRSITGPTATSLSRVFLLEPTRKDSTLQIGKPL